MKEDNLISIAQVWLAAATTATDGDSIERRLSRLVESDYSNDRDHYWNVGSLAICALAHRWMFLGGAEVNECDMTMLARGLIEIFSRSQDLTHRVASLNAAVRRLANDVPYPEEIEEWTKQRASMIAEVGTLRARCAELERLVKRDE